MKTVGTTEEEIIAFLTEKGHPALTMPPILNKFPKSKCQLQYSIIKQLTLRGLKLEI